jgi:hypothetical protein
MFAKAAATVEKNHHWVSNNLDSLNDWLLEALNR